ncbi:MAG: 5-aminolevulinate synthase [Proteobacteria bacterium]|nr:5-aminolevulinate synthase [Pseudomonadota bacterium]MDA1181140.1 5-aminolevulinate synthase [Pseudomonadota bacterium]
MKYSAFFKKELKKLKDEGLYRSFREIDRPIKKFPKADEFKNNKERDVEVWCSNDYLNMSQHPEVVNETVKTLLEIGTGSGGTRNISGTSSFHTSLEKKLANLHNKENALLFSSAYTANQSTLWTLGKKIKNLEIFSDELNHASLIQGIKNSGASCHIFQHNDVDHLESLLETTNPNHPKLIVFESLYSMEGIRSPIIKIVEIAKKYNAMTYLDEVHSVGLYGEKGKGIAVEMKVDQDIDIINGTLAKAFGQMGGYIAASNEIIDYIRSFSPGFIFTTSICPSIAAGANKAIEIVSLAEQLRIKIHDNASTMRQLLESIAIPCIDTNSHIIAVMINDPFLCKKVSEKLIEDHGIYAQPIFYPTVPKGLERLRITVTPKHRKEHIENMVKCLDKVWSNLSLPRKNSTQLQVNN